MTDLNLAALATLPPLQGCLYCHHEGTIKLAEGRKVLGLGSGLPSLTCSYCGAVAQFDPGADDDSWRIRYKKINDAPQYYYVMVYFSQQKWYDADEALEISRKGFVQRFRIDQVQHGDLGWMNAVALEPPPPLMAPSERVFLAVSNVSLQQPSQNSGFLSLNEVTVLDSGTFYVTSSRLHLIGARRDWANRLNEIRDIEHDQTHWRIYVGASRQCYSGLNDPEHLDAQLFTAIVKFLWKEEV
jgi:hypothetical protein